MSYEVGARIDLTSLNNKDGTMRIVSKETMEPEPGLYEVGTKLIFKLMGQEIKAVRRIRVVYV